MSTNGLDLRIVYESGSQELISAPDVSLQDGFAFQGEVVDVSDPDNGIWWHRNVIPMRGPDEEAEGEPWATLQTKTRVVSPESMRHAIGVYVAGNLTLARDPMADNECKLSNVLLDDARDDGGEDDEGGNDGDDELPV